MNTADKSAGSLTCLTGEDCETVAGEGDTAKVKAVIFFFVLLLVRYIFM